MLHMVGLLTTLRRWQEHKSAAQGANQVAGTGQRRTPDNGPAAKSRYALTMTRADVKSDLAEMAHRFSIDLDMLPHYRDELIDAENICAHCTTVGRCFRWKREGGRGDAPQLFCPNAELFSELATEPFWAETELRDWPANPAALPWCHLLKPALQETSDIPPRIEDDQLRAFADVVIKIDRITDYWAPRIDSAGDTNLAEERRRQADIEMDQAIFRTENMTHGDFRTIYYVALSDPTIARRIKDVLDEGSDDRDAA